jgi:hypothetical protein
MGKNPLDLPDDIFLATYEYGQSMAILRDITNIDGAKIADTAILACATAEEMALAAIKWRLPEVYAARYKFAAVQKHCKKLGIRFICDGTNVSPIADAKGLN